MDYYNFGREDQRVKAIYVRVSTEEQAKKGYSIEDQLAKCREKIGKDEEVVEYIDDGHSGEFLERPALTKLREDVRNGLIDTVICYDPDRWSRKLVHQLLITEEIEKNAEIIFVNHEYAKTPEGILFYQLRGAISEFEKAKINERMSGGRKRKALNGKVVKDAKVYGYKYNKEEGTLEIYEPEAKIVRLIFDLFTNPQGRVQGINGIAKYLTAQGVPTKKNAKVWHRQVVRQILMNETYTGVYYHNKWDTEGILANKYKKEGEEKVKQKLRPREEWIAVEVPAIIDRKTFELAQRLLKESRRRWAGKPKRKYLLSGLLRCGHCGNTLTGKRQKNWDRYDLEYTDIKNYSGAKNKGCGLRIRCEDLDEKVWQAFLSYIFENSEAIAEVAATSEESDVPYEEEELKRIETQLENIKKKRKNILSFVAENRDLIDENEIKEQLLELKETEEALLKAKEEIEESLKALQELNYSDDIRKEVAEELRNFSKHENLTLEQKQILLRKVIREIRVFKSGEIKIYKF